MNAHAQKAAPQAPSSYPADLPPAAPAVAAPSQAMSDEEALRSMTALVIAMAWTGGMFIGFMAAVVFL